MKKIVGAFLLVLVAALLIPAIPYNRIADAQTQQSPSVFLDPPAYNATQINQQFTVDINISDVQNLWGWAINVTWDTNYLTLVSKQEGDFLSSQYSTLFTPSPITVVPGAIAEDTYKEAYLQCAISTASNGFENSASGSGTLATMTFQTIRQTKSTPIVLGVVYLEEPNSADARVGTAHSQIAPSSYFSNTLVSLVLPGPPTANAGKVQTVPVGTQVVFNGTQSVSTGTNATYTWTFTDVTQQTLNGTIAKYTFNNPGNYTVTLTVTDSLGSDTSTVLIRVNGNPVTAAPTVTPIGDSNSTATSTPTTNANPDATSTPTSHSGSFTLPSDMLGILIVLTVFVLGGSVLWLRKRT